MSGTAPCPICGGTVFEPGPKGRTAPNGLMPRCTGCRSLERHRIFRIMFEKLGPASFSTWKAIQLSPDATIDPAWFASHELSVFGGPGSLDIQSIDRPDGAYDLVACSHVIEHVGDDRAALLELLRITAPDHRLDIGPGVVGRADVIEEIARIYGYERIPETRMADELPPQRGNPSHELEERARDVLVEVGLQEVVTYSLTHPDRERRLVHVSQVVHVRLLQP